MTNNVHRLLKMYKIDTNFDFDMTETTYIKYKARGLLEMYKINTNFDFPKLYEDDMTETDVHNLV